MIRSADPVVPEKPNDVQEVPEEAYLAAQRYIVDINGLVPTKSIHFNIVVRVMTIWKMYDTQNKKDVKSLELSLIDAQGSKIQATMPARIMKDFVKYFKDEGFAGGCHVLITVLT
ncbi:OLC1v1032070C1 [Oldenlandia corymbosa var. corymbosa]|uniref:OLC1v1032070C1 n=1 Tax=Oldenlandia corymbosa var. corymbosa TaxID=529605 RepID=A0AAV1CKC6_OLDCO|nr:OLC1v1032070C1 [Oldenlandia corymbosa var. corymbosa]